MKNEKQKIAKAYDPLEVGLPVTLWVEDMMLGIAMRWPERMTELSATLNADDFSSEANRLIWMACASLYERNIPTAKESVTTELSEFGQLETVGGYAKLLELCEWLDCPNVPDLQKWCSQLRDFAQRRKLIFKANEMLIQASLPLCDIGALLNDGSDSLARLGAELAPDAAFKTPLQILEEFGGLNAYGSQPPPEKIVDTPFSALNNYLPMRGFVGGDLIVLAGHTSRGKSALAVNLALHAVYKKKRVVLVSLEMWEGAIFDRLVSLTGRIDGYDLHRVRHPPVEEYERRKKIRDSVYAVSELSIAISYRPGTTAKKLLSDLKRFKAVNGLDLVIVDYLQLMSGSGRAGASRAEDVGGISSALKRMAGELNIPIIALSQFNRDSAKQDREPELYDLKESGSIEQDASIVLLMHTIELWDMAANKPDGKIKLTIAKQRNGIVSWIPLNFNAPTGEFSEPGDYR